MIKLKKSVFLYAFSIGLAALLNTAAANVRAMTFNLRCPCGDVDQYAWDVRRTLVVDILNKYEADFVVTQETVAHYLEYLEQEVPEYAWFGRGRADNGSANDEGVQLFYLKDRWEVVEGDSGTFQLSETPDVPGSVDWTSLPRITTWGRFREKSTGNTLYVYNTHWDHRTGRDECSRLSAERIAQRQETDDPVIFMGDFNQSQNQNSIRYLMGEDVFNTPPPVAMVDTDPDLIKIDHVFIWPDTAEIIEAGRIVERYDIDGYTNVSPSDHDPTLAEVKFWPDVVSIARNNMTFPADKPRFNAVFLNGKISISPVPSSGSGNLSGGRTIMYTLDGRKIQLQ